MTDKGKDAEKTDTEAGTDAEGGDKKEKKKGLAKLAGGLTSAVAVVKKEPPPKLVAGNYVVHVHVIEGRDLKGRDASAMSDPVAKVEVMGQKQTTKILKKQLSPMFDEVLVFEFKDCLPEEIERGKCVIRILDANTFRKDVLIGLFEFDLATIYFGKFHELYRQWVALTDVTDKNEGIQGHLKVSITVLGPNDEQHIHSAAEADDDDGGMLGVLMPPEVEQRGRLLRIKCYEVQDLPVMDEGLIGSKCDPYVWVEFAGVDLKTKHFKGQQALMLQELAVPVMEPSMTSSIKVNVFDWDQAGSDDRIANLTFDYNKIKDAGEKGFPPKWYPLYGAPEGKQSGLADKMNKSFLPGTFYRGRILLALTTEDSKDPKKGITTCNGLMEGQGPKTQNWKIEFDLYEGSEIPEKGKMHVEVHCGKHSTSSDKVECKEGMCQWYSPLKDIVAEFPEDPEQVPDVFVYICAKDKRLSFLRFPMTELAKRAWAVPPVWHILAEDPILDALTASEFPGSLLFSLRAGAYNSAPAEPDPRSRPLKYDIDPAALGGTDAGDTTATEVDEGDPSAPGSPASPTQESKTYEKRFEEGKISKVGTLTLELVEAVNLPAMDRGGTSDPYVKFKIPPGQSVKSKVKKKTLSPKWNEVFVFKDVSVDNPLEMTVYDQDLTSDDKIGEQLIDLKSMQLASKTPMGKDFTHDAWFFLQGDKTAKGQVHLKFKFQYLSLAESQSKLVEIEKKTAKKEKSIMHKIRGKKEKKFAGSDVLGYPERRDYQLRCHIYQARGLPALDSNGLADPYVIIRCAGRKIKLERREKTLNPQWYETHDMNIQAPFPFHFAPRIQVFVFDWDQVGKDDPLGRFSISFQEASTMNPSPDEILPKWFPLTDFEGKDLDGSQLLASFQLLSAAEVNLSSKERKSIEPEKVKMNLEITTLGLRSLQSTLGVHKAFIDFELPNGKRFHTRQSNKPSAASPNFLQVLKIPVDLPVRKIFAPTLLIEVRDVLLGGFFKRLIGTAALDMSSFMVEDEKGNWAPASTKVDLLGDTPEEDGKKPVDEGKGLALMGKLEAAEKQAQDDDKEKEEKEEKEAAEEKKAAEPVVKKAEGGDDAKVPLLSGESSGDAKLDVKDDGTGVGEIGAGGADTPLTGGEDITKAKQDFKSSDQAFDKYDPMNDKNVPDEEEEVPKYMKGRITIDDELEDNMKLSPFHTITVNTGKKGSILDKFRKVGTFKGLIRLMDEKADAPPAFDTKELLQPVELYCRLYILKGYGMTPKDDDGMSDPYLIIQLGKKKFSTRDHYISNSLEPSFFERFEIPCIIPGDAQLEITCMDWDGIGDDLIGKTTIDIEDRWFTKEWRKIGLKPLERRTLRSKTSTHSQGKLECWVELLTPEQAKKTPMLEIKPPPPDPYELRIVIWGTREVTIKDEITNQNDLYVTCSCSVPGLKKQETDIHFRSKKGKGNFNWRCKFPITLPIAPWPRLRFQIWDFDLLAANDSICETVMTLKGLCKRAMKKKDRVKIFVKNKDRFWLENLRHPNETKTQGKMEISIEIMPESMASQLPAGFGRSDPNGNPFLPPPEGRINWSLFHPLDMLKEILGPEIYRKLCLGCVCILCSVACVFIMPMIFSNIMGNLLTPGR